MNRPPLMDPRRIVALAEFFPQSCDIQSPVRGRTTTGGLGETTWTDVDGMSDIPCIVSSISTTEQKSPDTITTKSSHVIGLAGWYPNIRASMRVVVNDDDYDIVGIEHDELGTRTQLMVQILSNTAVPGQ